METSLSHSPTTLPKPREPKNSAYGIESLETTISSLSHDSDDSEERVRNARHNWKRNLGQQMSRQSEEDLASAGSPSLKSFGEISRNTSPSYQRRSSQATISRPFTPLSFGSPAPPSIMSSPDSRRNSDAGSFMDDAASQAIISSGEDEGNPGSEMIDSGSAPQLVMPSIKMPSRRPFTERGKNMGRLKILIAGDSGGFLELPGNSKLTCYRCWKDLTHQSYRSDLRRYCSCRPSLCYPNSDPRNTAEIKNKVKKRKLGYTTHIADH
jgi:hypothetical protein